MSTFIPAKYRKVVYGIFAFIGLCLGAAQVGFASAGSDQPVWLTVAFAVFGFVSTGVGYVAASNTPAHDPGA